MQTDGSLHYAFPLCTKCKKAKKLNDKGHTEMYACG